MKKNDEQKLIKQLEAPALDLLETVGAVPSGGVRIQSPDLPEGKRQILIVKSYVMYAASWLASTANPKVAAQPYIQLFGAPSPSSKVEMGYIRFVDVSELRRPTYSAATKRIDLYADYRSMRQVLAQLEHQKRYLWVGHFKGGHIYGDLHSTS